MNPIKIMLMRKAGAAALDTQTMTSAIAGSLPFRNIGYKSGTLGSMSDGTSNIYGGASILELFWDENDNNPNRTILKIQGVQSNSGWTTLSVDAGGSVNRANAIFSTATGNSVWTWDDTGNLFPAGTRTITFT